MRISGIFALIALSLILQSACAWWAAAVRGIEPIILSFGAAFAAFGLNDKSSHNEEQSPFDMKKYFLNENKNVISEYIMKYDPDHYHDIMKEMKHFMDNYPYNYTED